MLEGSAAPGEQDTRRISCSRRSGYWKDQLLQESRILEGSAAPGEQDAGGISCHYYSDYATSEPGRTIWRILLRAHSSCRSFGVSKLFSKKRFL